MKVHVILSKTFRKIQNYQFSYFYNVDFFKYSTIKSEITIYVIYVPLQTASLI